MSDKKQGFDLGSYGELLGPLEPVEPGSLSFGMTIQEYMYFHDRYEGSDLIKRRRHEWVHAVASYDDGDPEPLGALLLSAWTLPEYPPEVRVALAEIVRGKRTPRGQGKRLMTINARAAVRLEVGRYLLDKMAPGIYAARGQKQGIRKAGWLGALKDEAVTALASKYGVSKGTIEEEWKKVSARKNKTIASRRGAERRNTPAAKTRVYRSGRLVKEK